MTEKDKQIINKVKNTPWGKYDEVMDLEEECDSEEARGFVHDFCVRAYHREEAMSGMI